MEINSLKLSFNENLKKLDDLESELSKLNEKFIISTTTTPNDENTIEENTNIIKLKLFQSIGIKFNVESREVLILNKSKNSISLLKIDDSYSEYFISNYIWDNI